MYTYIYMCVYVYVYRVNPPPLAGARAQAQAAGQQAAGQVHGGGFVDGQRRPNNQRGGAGGARISFHHRYLIYTCIYIYVCMYVCMYI